MSRKINGNYRKQLILVPPLGLERSLETAKISTAAVVVPPLVPPSGPIVDDLIEVFERLSAVNQRAVIDFAIALDRPQKTQNSLSDGW